MDEATGEIGATPEAKDAFSIEVARAWEEAFFEASTPATRKVALRTAMVFAASKGGVYRSRQAPLHGGWGAPFPAAVHIIPRVTEASLGRPSQGSFSQDTSAGP